ncbi:MAG TPA: NAD-dependent deacylase [Candidatus Omnitrophota bacterium]|nr:NAD-dependent deacylase [Candidatus Omnitrophota bacterium]HPT07236.1 NAD-dependent deacylase [Candidatus Omnitrophota bacterium]
MLAYNAIEFIKKHCQEGPIVALTGAGISAESGIPTFRGKGGLWERYDPEVFAYPDRLRTMLDKNPSAVADFLIDLYTVLTKANPHDGHRALALLEKEGVLSGIITQNIDNLHQRAGSRMVGELHGNAFRIKCMNCARSVTYERDRITEMAGSIVLARSSKQRLLRVLSRYFPECPCGGRFRTDIVLFGETLSSNAMGQAYELLNACRMFFIIGTSLTVFPAAGLPSYARKQGALLVEINNEETPLTRICDLVIRQPASIALPALVETLGYA